MAKISKEAANEIMQWKINSPNVSVETLRELNGLLISMTEPEPEPERQKLKQAAVLPAQKIEVGQWMKFIDRNVIKKCVRIEWNNALASPSRTINLHWKGEWRYYIDEFEYWVDSEIIPVVSIQLPDDPIRVGSWVEHPEFGTSLFFELMEPLSWILRRAPICSIEFSPKQFVIVEIANLKPAKCVPDWAKGGK